MSDEEAWALWEENLAKQRFRHLKADALLTSEPGGIRGELHVAFCDDGPRRRVIARALNGIYPDEQRLLVIPATDYEPRSRERYEMYHSEGYGVKQLRKLPE